MNVRLDAVCFVCAYSLFERGDVGQLAFSTTTLILSDARGSLNNTTVRRQNEKKKEKRKKEIKIKGEKIPQNKRLRVVIGGRYLLS